MAETQELEQTAELDADKATDATPESPVAKDAPSVTVVAPPAPANPVPETPPDDDLQVLIEKVKATITNSLDEQNFDKQLRKHIKKIKGWKDWSEHAKSAFAHMWAAQLLHNKAVDIKKDNEMDFTPVTGDSYKKLVRSLTHRVRF
jgi:hypothetical protein